MRDLALPSMILAIPPLAALGHDIYMAYNNTALDVSERFYFSDLGWIWIHYSPETYDWAVANTDPGLWGGFIDPVLQGSAFFVLLMPLVIFLTVHLCMKILGVGRYHGHGLSVMLYSATKKGGGKKGFAFGGGGKGPTKYKRK